MRTFVVVRVLDRTYVDHDDGLIALESERPPANWGDDDLGCDVSLSRPLEGDWERFRVEAEAERADAERRDQTRCERPRCRDHESGR